MKMPVRRFGASSFVYSNRLTDHIRKGFDSESRGFGGLHAIGRVPTGISAY